jgi:hypothetical protein
MDQNRTRNQDVPNRSSNMEEAEGSRENARGSDRSRNRGGITNRSLDREQCEQEQLPERGRSQSER